MFLNKGDACMYVYVCPFEKQYNKLESCLLPAYKTPQSVKKTSVLYGIYFILLLYTV